MNLIILTLNKFLMNKYSYYINYFKNEDNYYCLHIVDNTNYCL